MKTPEEQIRDELEGHPAMLGMLASISELAFRILPKIVSHDADLYIELVFVFNLRRDPLQDREGVILEGGIDPESRPDGV